MNKEKQNTFRQFSAMEALHAVQSETCFDGTPIDPIHERASTAGGFSFTGTDSMEECLHLALHGWKARPALANLSGNLAIAGQHGENVQTVMDVQGSFPDVAAYLQGEPEHMVSFQTLHSPRVIRLGVNIASNGDMPESTFHRRGAVAMATCDALIRAGYAVEIIALSSSYRDNVCMDHAIKIKESNQPLDEDGLAFWVCHPSALRRVVMGLMERENKAMREHFGFHRGGGYGGSNKYDAARTGLEMDILIDNPSLHTQADMEKFIAETLAPFMS